MTMPVSVTFRDGGAFRIVQICGHPLGTGKWGRWAFTGVTGADDRIATGQAGFNSRLRPDDGTTISQPPRHDPDGKATFRLKRHMFAPSTVNRHPLKRRCLRKQLRKTAREKHGTFEIAIFLPCIVEKR